MLLGATGIEDKL